MRKGLEPVERYYRHPPESVRTMTEYEPDVYPPPDHAIEIDIIHRSSDRQPIYAALDVPELWRWDGQQFRILQLHDGAYRQSDASSIFPGVPMADFLAFVPRMLKESQLAVLREFQVWARALPQG